MKYIGYLKPIGITLALLFLNLYAVAQKPTPVANFGSNPGNLKMYLYSPNNLNNQGPLPLVVVLHGCLQSAGVVAKQSGWNKLADTYGFRVLYPQQRFLNNPGKCFCWYKRSDIEKGKGEAESVKQMIEELRKTGIIDSTKIFITGLSAGAAMSVALMAVYPETFNAGAVFAGGAYKTATNLWTAWLSFYGWRIKSAAKWGELVREQNPTYTGSYPRMIIYQGNADVVVNKRNGSQLMKQWTNLHHLSTTPSETIKHFAKVKAVEKNIYRDSTGKALVMYYRVKHLGHALLVDPGKCFNQGGRLLAFSSDKNYFSSYWTAVDFGLIDLHEIQGKQEVNKNEQHITYSIHPSNLHAKFSWSFPKDCRIVEDKGNIVTVDWGTKPGNVDVTEYVSEKCKRVYPTRSVQLLKP